MSLNNTNDKDTIKKEGEPNHKDEFVKSVTQAAKSGVGMLGDLAGYTKKRVLKFSEELKPVSQDKKKVIKDVYEKAKHTAVEGSESLQKGYGDLKEEYKEYRKELEREAGHPIIDDDSKPTKPFNERETILEVPKEDSEISDIDKNEE